MLWLQMAKNVNSHLSTPVVNYCRTQVVPLSKLQYRRRRIKNKYIICYLLTHKGRHQLHVKVEGVPIRGSPFAVIAVKNLSTPVRTIGGVNGPWGVAVNQRGEIIPFAINKPS